jgi:Cu/Ag efflux protein CusF
MKKVLTLSLFVFLFAGAAAYASGHKPHEGKITAIDMDQKTITVAGEHGDNWTIYWNDMTKVKNAKVGDLKNGDTIHFDYKEQDGKMWATEIRRTHTAPAM